jgi:ribonuclease-3
MVAARRRKPGAARIEDALGHRFAEPQLLQDALAHAGRVGGRHSSGLPRHERLEFLGDRVLGLVIAEALLQRHPADPEGALSRRLAALVRAETLARIAGELGVEGWLRPAAGSGPVTDSVLADTLESVIGALYLDGGLAVAQQFVLDRWAGLLDDMGEPLRDPKTALQEWAQARALPLPAYRLVEAAGPDHAPSFRVEVTVGEAPPALGEGRSKRTAEQIAAARLLTLLGERRDG